MASRIGTGGTKALFVHGNDLCGEFYAPLARELEARGVSSTLITLPGFHKEPPLEKPSWSGLVDVVVEAAEGHNLLVGHSMGGLIALLAAARRPACVNKLALLEPAIFPGRLFAELAARRYLGRVVDAERDRFTNWNGGMRRVHDERTYPRAKIDLYLEVRASSDVATGRALFSSMPELYPLPYDDVAIPTLLVTGANTGIVGRMMARSLRKNVRRVASVEIPRGAHWLANEQDALIADAIARFVA